MTRPAVAPLNLKALELEARKDNFGRLVPSDVRQLIGALRRTRLMLREMLMWTSERAPSTVARRSWDVMDEVSDD